jgi:Cysteine-rich secretory protein family
MKRLLAKFLIPLQSNKYHPHSIRPNTLLFYVFLILAIQLFYNFSQTGQAKVLSYATDIRQGEIIKLTNTERAQAGAVDLRESSTLDQAAAKKAADMFAHDYWAHTSPTGTTPWFFFDQVGYKYTYAGENLARDFDTSSGVVAGWMASPSHRENLLSTNYTEIGVAVANGVLLDHDTTLVVQLFGRPSGQPVLGSSGTPELLASASVQTAAPETDQSSPADLIALSHLSASQKLILGILVFLFAFFLFDAWMVERRGGQATRGHSLAHSLVIGMMIVIFVSTSLGVLR